LGAKEVVVVAAVAARLLLSLRLKTTHCEI
jgi:hypothetical protein